MLICQDNVVPRIRNNSDLYWKNKNAPWDIPLAHSYYWIVYLPDWLEVRKRGSNQFPESVVVNL